MPYKLKRPLFRLFRGVTIILVPALIVFALIGNQAGLILAAMFGGSLWFVLAIILLCNWQVVTLFEDHLTVVNFGTSQTVLYRDIQRVQAEHGLQGINGPIAVPTVHLRQKTSVLKINLANIAAADRIVLLKTIQEHAPQAKLNHYAEEILQGIWKG